MKKYLPFLLGFLFLFLSFIPNIYEATVINLLPKDRVMIWGEHNYTYDYNVLLSKIKQGQEGAISVVDKYDNSPTQKGIFLQMLYLLSGRMTAPLHFSPTLTYQLLRTVAAFFWVLTIIYLNLYFLKKPRLYILGIVFSLLAASFPRLYHFQNQLWFGSFMDWWQELDILKRVSFVPHATINYIAIAALSILLDKKKYFYLIPPVLFISIFVHPVAALVFFFSWILYHLIKKDLADFGKKTAIIIISIAVPLLYIKYVTSSYPWKSLVDFDILNRWNFSIKEYILALGPIFFTGAAGLILALKKKNWQILPLATWVLAAFLGMILFKFFPYQSEMRFIQSANHIPLAILSTWFFFQLWEKNQVIKFITVIAVITIISLGLTQTYFSLKSQTQFIYQRATAAIPLVPYPPQVMYPLTDFWGGILWLEKNSSRNSVVLAKVTAGNYIPAYAGNFVYFGHATETPHFADRQKQVDNFFSGTLSEKQALQFLRNENISYVFWGPQEKENSLKDISQYPFLKPVYQTPMVTIFKVIK